MPSETLSLFPSPTQTYVHKPCLKKSSRAVRTPSPVCKSPHSAKPEVLRGLALQFSPKQGTEAAIDPTQSHIKHSLFCGPELPRSDSPMQNSKLDATRTSPLAAKRDEASPSQLSIAHSSAVTSPIRHTHPVSPPRIRSPQSLRPGTPEVHCRPVNLQQSPPVLPARDVKEKPTQSIFPTYDHSLPLLQQHYYPAPTAHIPPPRPSSMRRSSSASRPALTLATSGSAAPKTQIAGLSELESLWAAVSGKPQSRSTSKVRLTMHKDTSTSGSDESLEIGFSNFYSFTCKTLAPSRLEDASAEMLVRRHHPLNDVTIPVAQIDLAQTRNDGDGNHRHSLATTIFPQTAALAALEAAATSAQAQAISRHDPNASSPQAAQLAFDAVSEAKQDDQSELVCASEKNQFGAPQNKYALRHPRLGNFDIKVKGRINLVGGKLRPTDRFSRSHSYERISIHLPHDSAAGKAVAAATGRTSPPAIASLDLTAGVLEIDVAALRDLESQYMIDTVVCALMAVAVMETEVSTREAKTEPCTFAGPPMHPTATSSSASQKQQHKKNKKSKTRMSRDDNVPSSSSSSPFASPSTKRPSWARQWRNSFKRDRRGGHAMEKPLPPLPLPPTATTSADKKKKKNDTEFKLPVVTRVLLKVLGFSFDAIVWLLGLGFKVLAKLLMGIGKAMSKS